MKNLSFFILMFVSAAEYVAAQTPFFKSVRLEETAPNAESHLVYESEEGFLYFGTTEGLFAFDGIEFTPFLRPNNDENEVTAIFQSRNKTFWIGYRDGAIFHLQKQKIIPWQPEEGTPAVAITGFTEDSLGQLWIATYGEGLYCYDGQHLYNFATEDGLGGNDIYTLAADKSNNVYAGTDSGISVCSFRKGDKKLNNITRDQGLPDNIVRTLITDEKDGIWIGTYDGGLIYFHSETGKMKLAIEEWPYGVITSFELFEDKELWIGTEEKGVIIYGLTDGSLGPLITEGNSKVYDLHRDTEGNIWILNQESGIRYAQRRFDFLPLDFSEVQTVLVDAKGNIWLGTREGLYKSQKAKNGLLNFSKYSEIPDENIISLYEDRLQNIWIGTFGEGVILFNEETGLRRRIREKEGLKNGSILSINGINGHVWLATLGGVSEIDLDEKILTASNLSIRNLGKEDGLSTNYIYKIFLDSAKNIWFATDGQGISVLRNGKIENYPVAEIFRADTIEKIPLRSVYSLTEDHSGKIWLSTAEQGVFSFDGQKFKRLQAKTSKRKMTVTSLMTDANGDILMAHPTGLNILSPSDEHLIYYEESAGILDIDPALNAADIDQEGNIWFGTKDGLIRNFSFSENLTIHPRTILKNVTVLSESIDYQARNTFDQKDSYIGFEFAGIWLTDPAAVKFRYKLDGYDPEWKETKDRRVSYSALPPGNYTFRLTSTENEAWADEPVVSYTFTILTPLWLRWWFIAGSILLIGSILIYIFKRREAQIEKENFLERQHTTSRFEVLKSQINPHFLFNSFNTLAATIEENPEAAVVYVEKMSDFYRVLLEHRDKQVISLEEELKSIKIYNFLLKQRFGNNFNLTINVDKSEPIYIVPLALQLLIENAVKHNVVAKSEPLFVEIYYDANLETISISNNLQPKMQQIPSTNFGLQSLKKQYSYLTGKEIKIQQTEEIFKVDLPVIKKEKP